MKTKQLQQGDVCLTRAKIPAGAKNKAGNVLRDGETTGHAHRVTGTDFNLFESDGRLYVDVKSPDCALVHEEHHVIELPVGQFEITPVYEYDHFLEESRRVRD